MPRPSEPLLDADQFRAEAAELRRVAPRSAESVRRASALVTEGIVVSAAEPPPEPRLAGTGRASTHVPQPFALSSWHEGTDDWRAANHRLEVDIHGAASMTHIDALDHFVWEGRALGGGGLAELSAGIVSRGVLLDIPAATGTNVPAGHVVTLEDVRATLSFAAVTPHAGDTLFVRFGRAGERSSRADLADPMPGLSIECRHWLAETGVGVVVTDVGLDPSPSEVVGVPVPWHILLLAVLGIPLVDWGALTSLSATCARLGRYEFASVLAPLPIPGSSGSPVNPLAIF